jgi:hypothetical protein
MKFIAQQNKNALFDSALQQPPVAACPLFAYRYVCFWILAIWCVAFIHCLSQNYIYISLPTVSSSSTVNLFNGFLTVKIPSGGQQRSQRIPVPSHDGATLDASGRQHFRPGKNSQIDATISS